MKTFLKYLGILLLVLLLLIILTGFYFNSTGIPSYPNKAPELDINVDSAGIVEGERMAHLLCSQCHMSKDGRLGGNHMVDASFGEIHAPNITQHPEYGIKDYTAGELAYLLRTGIKKDGVYAPPYMVKLPLLSDADLHNVIAFLQSDHPLVAPSSNQQPVSKPNLMMKVLSNIALKPLPFPTSSIPVPDKTKATEWGRYLATAKFECYSCHSESFVTTNLMEPHKTPGFFGGGNPIPDLEGKIILSANLTRNKETGLGTWTKTEFIRTVRLGIRPDGSPLRYPMLPFTLLNEDEVGAIWEYLQTVPEIENSKDFTEY